MSTHKLFKKHFGSQIAVDLKHPNMESFFEELNEECLQEDRGLKTFQQFCKDNYNLDIPDRIVDEFERYGYPSDGLPSVSDSLHIDFAVYLTGHDRETIEQMYNDWRQ
ncbi:MAG: hypothetical protein ACLFQE_08390 [Thermotogota bacterium]